LSCGNLDHVSFLIDGIQLPNDHRNLEAILDHVERGEGDDFGQAGLGHVDVDANVVAAAKIQMNWF